MEVGILTIVSRYGRCSPFVLLSLALPLMGSSGSKLQADSHGYLGSQVCGTCHGDISRRYFKTAMAQASGLLKPAGLPPGEVDDEKDRITYSFRWQSGVPQLTYSRRLDDGTTVSGVKELVAFLGSGRHAQGFVFEEHGQPFQSPIAYYGAARGWDLAPGYEKEKQILLSRKIETGCLSCHVSGVATSNKRLFNEGAVSCERCHGPGAKHVAAIQSGTSKAASLTIVNPAKLAPEARDSVCAQCHLTGETRVAKPNRSELTYVAGDRLNEHIVPFVFPQTRNAGLKVIGHFEGLWQSKCKRSSGDRLWCGTCHDPHREVAASEKLVFYRAKCLSCHQESSCTELPLRRARQQDSCVACHMQQRQTIDGQHTAFTDHTIAKVPSPNRTGKPPGESLRPFWTTGVTPRDEALAAVDLVWLRGDAVGIEAAHRKLQSALPQVGSDAALEADLAYTNDLAGDEGAAEALYRKALLDAPDNLLALTNLATHLARKGQAEQAIELWEKALAINPGLLPAGLNLARVRISQGNAPDALRTLKEVLSLNPDSKAALELYRKLVPSSSVF